MESYDIYDKGKLRQIIKDMKDAGLPLPRVYKGSKNETIFGFSVEKYMKQSEQIAQMMTDIQSMETTIAGYTPPVVPDPDAENTALDPVVDAISTLAASVAAKFPNSTVTVTQSGSGAPSVTVTDPPILAAEPETPVSALETPDAAPSVPSN